MNALSQGKNLIAGTALFLCFSALPLLGVEGSFQPSGFVNTLLNNQYLLESIRLTKLAEECYAIGEYDEAIRYAKEAMKYADWSDIYVTQQLKMKGAQDAIAAAQERLDWAVTVEAPKRFAEIYQQAQGRYENAQESFSGEHWDEAREAALQVLAILAEIKDVPILPAQYLVKTWDPRRDCLWNIAGKPQIYGDPSKWTIIYDANKSKLSSPDNPNLIYPGMILDIPSINGEIRSGLWEE